MLLLQNAVVQVALGVAAVIIYVSHSKADGCSAARPEGCVPVIGAPILLCLEVSPGSKLENIACQTESLPLAQVAAALYAMLCVHGHLQDLLVESVPPRPPNALTGRHPVNNRYAVPLGCCHAS